MPEEKYSNIAKTRNEDLLKKEAMFKLLDESYVGGQKYLDGDNLTQYPRESENVFNSRKSKSIYFNYIQPIVDILTGFIMGDKIGRDVPEAIKFLEEGATKSKSMVSFMQSVVSRSMMYTVGVLVDSPSFNPARFPTKADAERAGLKPYAVMYHPNKIRDFHYDDNDKLDWVILDNSYIDNSDPLVKSKKVTVYRLWTKAYYQDFNIKSVNGADIVEPDDQVYHKLRCVPFMLVNWRDVDGNHVSESPFEDVALISKQIYQTLSLIDETMHNGTIQTLFMPAAEKKDLDDIDKDGLYDIPVVNFNPNTTQSPFFAGANLSNIEGLKTGIGIYILEIFRKIGMDQDRDKTFVQSGRAMTKEFQKTESLLKAGSLIAEQVEHFIFVTAGKWLNHDYSKDDVIITYTRDYQDDDVDGELERLYRLYSLGYQNLSDESLSEIVRLTLPNADSDSLVGNAKLSPESWVGQAIENAQAEKTQGEVE